MDMLNDIAGVFKSRGYPINLIKKRYSRLSGLFKDDVLWSKLIEFENLLCAMKLYASNGDSMEAKRCYRKLKLVYADIIGAKLRNMR